MISISLLATLLAAGTGGGADAETPAHFVEVIGHLALDRREGPLALFQWAYACKDSARCAGACGTTLAGLGSLGTLEPKTLCSEFKQAVRWTPTDLVGMEPPAIVWVKGRFKKAAEAVRPRLDADDRIKLDCHLARLDLGGDPRACVYTEALVAAATLSRLAKDPDVPKYQGFDAVWTHLCFELESCARECTPLLKILPQIDPSAADKIPLCAEARESLGGAPADAKKLYRYAKQRTARFVVTASKLLDPARGQRLRCDAALLGLIPAEPACTP